MSDHIRIDESAAVSELAKKGCLVWLTVSRPSLSGTLSADSLGLPSSFDEVASPPSIRPPSSTYSVFNKLEARARNAVSRRALSGGEAKFVPFGLLESLVKDFEAVRFEYLEYAQVFLSTYPEAVRTGLERWETEARVLYRGLDRSQVGVSEEAFVERVRAAVSKTWPSVDTLERRFGMKLRVLQFALPGIGNGVAADAGAFAGVARQMASESLSGFYADLVGELRAKTVEMAEQVRSALNGPRFSEKSLTSLRTFLAKFSALNVCDDREIATYVGELEAMLGDRTAAQIKEDAPFKESLNKTLNEIVSVGTGLVEEAADSAQEMLVARFGAGKRKVA